MACYLRCSTYPEVVMAKSRLPARRASVVRKRKNILVDQRKLDAAKTALVALTETATIDAALDLVVFRTEVFRALDRVAAAGGFAPVGRSRRAG